MCPLSWHCWKFKKWDDCSFVRFRKQARKMFLGTEPRQLSPKTNEFRENTVPGLRTTPFYGYVGVYGEVDITAD